MKRNDAQRPAGSPVPPTRHLDPLALATLAGVVAVLMLSFSNMRDLDRLDRTLGERLGKLETQLAQGANRAAQPAQVQQGPDPNRIYTVKLAGAPTKGPDTAPVTIAAFSEFQ